MERNEREAVASIYQKNLLKTKDVEVSTDVSADTSHYSRSQTPKFQRTGYAYFVFFLLGLVVLFPFNAFMKAQEFFRDRFAGTSYADTYQQYIIFLFTFSNCTTVALLNITKIDTRIAVEKRVMGSMIIFAIVSLCTCIMPFSMLDGYSYFGITLFLVSVAGITTANMQNSIYGLAALFPGIYMQALSTGQGAAGVAVSLSNLIMSWIQFVNSSTQDKKITACAYFAVALVAVVAGIVGFQFLKKLEIYKYYSDLSKHKNFHPIDEFNSESVIIEKESLSAARSTGLASSENSIMHVLKLIWPFAASVFLVFFVCLAVIPYHFWIKSATYKQPSLYNALFSPLAFFIFDLGDIIGKALPGWSFLSIKKNKLIFLLSCLRIGFLPLFIFGNVVLHDKNYEEIEIHTPRIFVNDVYFFFVVLMQAVSNGYLGSILMIKAPMSVEPSMRERAGSLMVMFLTLGVTSGSFFAFALRAIHCRCDPFAP